MKRLLLGLLVAALALTVAGCSAVEDEIGEEIGEGIAGAVVGGDVEVEGDSVTISGEDGDVAIEGGGAELPDGFPDDFPMHDEAPVDSASSIRDTDGTTYYVNLTSELPPGELHDWYKAEFADGWTEVSDVSAADGGDETYIMSVTKGDIEASITMASEGAGTQMGIILVTK
jgi:predicted small secreted protein